jgi:hypothetical protein
MDSPDSARRAQRSLHTPPFRLPLTLPSHIEVAEMEPTVTEMPNNDELSSAEQAWEMQQTIQEHSLDLDSSQSPHESPLLSPTPGDSADNSKSSAPIQKRRRVTRACDGMRSLHVVKIVRTMHSSNMI